MINPMCDMDWNIYLDYLADQGFADLRDEFYFAIISTDINLDYHANYGEDPTGTGKGEGTRQGCSFTNNYYGICYGETEDMHFNELDTIDFGCGHGSVYNNYNFNGSGAKW